MIVRYLRVLRDRSVHTWYGTDGSHLTLSLGWLRPVMRWGEQARSVNLLGIRSRGGVNGVTRLANGQNSSWAVGSSLTVLGSCRKTGVSLWGCMGSLTTGSPTGPFSTFGESGLNVQSGHSKDCARSELCSVGTGVTEKVTKIDRSFLGLSSPVLFPGVRVPSGASCVDLSFDLG